VADIDPFAKLMRRQEWGTYAAALLSMANHPGTTRDNARPMTGAQIAEKADEMLRLADERFGWKDNG
jgi:hypothetical protein